MKRTKPRLEDFKDSSDYMAALHKWENDPENKTFQAMDNKLLCTEGRIIGYKVQEDCTLGYRNYEYEDEIIIDDHCEDHNWPGTMWYDLYPQIFKPIYEGQQTKP